MIDRDRRSASGLPRKQLPTDPAGLPPMGPDFDEALEAGLEALGLADSPAADAAARASYEAHARLLGAWGAAINLTAIRQPSDVALRHVCDSLCAIVPLSERLRPGASLLDLGSGAGYPGLPLAAGLPLGRVTLLDSVTKKARFLEVAAAAVRSALAAGGRDTPALEAISERAEDLAEEPDRRGTWDAVTARAVGSLAEVVELAAPLLREAGLIVAWKREEEREGLRAELRDAGSIIRATGGGRPEVLDVATEALPGHRLVIIRKERPTPSRFPRPPGVRRRRG